MAESGLLETWPKGPDGEPERAVLLENAGDFAAFGGLICSMLESFGIPYLTRRRSDFSTAVFLPRGSGSMSPPPAWRRPGSFWRRRMERKNFYEKSPGL